MTEYDRQFFASIGLKPYDTPELQTAPATEAQRFTDPHSTDAFLWSIDNRDCVELTSEDVADFWRREWEREHAMNVNRANQRMGLRTTDWVLIGLIGLALVGAVTVRRIA